VLVGKLIYATIVFEGYVEEQHGAFRSQRAGQPDLDHFAVSLGAIYPLSLWNPA
jgi:hypothetical protein